MIFVVATALFLALHSLTVVVRKKLGWMPNDAQASEGIGVEMSNAMRYWTMIAVLLAATGGHGLPVAWRVDSAGKTVERFSQGHRELPGGGGVSV